MELYFILKKMATGDIEIDVDDVELLGTANSKLPITVREKIKVCAKLYSLKAQLIRKFLLRQLNLYA